jgi:hypothetical protein
MWEASTARVTVISSYALLQVRAVGGEQAHIWEASKATVAVTASYVLWQAHEALESKDSCVKLGIALHEASEFLPDSRAHHLVPCDQRGVVAEEETCARGCERACAARRAMFSQA